MTFRFTVEGQAASWNSAFRIVRNRAHGYQQLGKTEAATQWQYAVERACAEAKPPDWKVEGQIRIRYWLRLARAIDADNVLKLINDGIALGLGTRVAKMKLVPIYNDSRFLPCVEELSTGHKEPHVMIEISPFSGIIRA